MKTKNSEIGRISKGWRMLKSGTKVKAGDKSFDAGFSAGIREAARVCENIRDAMHHSPTKCHCIYCVTIRAIKDLKPKK